MVRVGWPRTRSSDQSERCTKETSTCDKIEKILPTKGGGRARCTGKSIDELKKVTPCNRCGAIGWEEDCTQPARSRKKRSPLQRAKEKVVGSGEKSDGKGRGGSSNYPIVEVYNDGSKNLKDLLFHLVHWLSITL